MVATLPGTSTCELTCTLGNFDSSLFELSEAQNFAENATYQSYETEKLVVASNKVTIATAVTASSVSIAGMKEVSAAPAAEDEFQVTITTGTPGSTDITFFAGAFADGSEVVVNYTKTVTVKEIVVDNKASAIGTVVAKYPVYSSGEDKLCSPAVWQHAA